MWSETRKILGTDITIQVVSRDLEKQHIDEAFRVFQGIEREFSRFSLNSELSQLNKYKKGKKSDRFLHLLRLSKNMYNITEGYFNPLVNISLLGYSQSFEKNNFIESSGEQDLSMEEIHISGDMVHLKNAQNLDFGGIAKGFAVDIASKILLTRGYTDFCINAGDDIYAAGKKEDGEKWSIGIEHPTLKGKMIGKIEISGRSVSISKSYEKKWNIGKEVYHHIYNPIKEKNTEEIVSITVISQEAYLSDSYATAIFNMGIEKALMFSEKYNIPIFLIGSDGKTYHNSILTNEYNLKIF